MEARNLLDQLMEESKKQYVSPFYVAIVYAGLGENDKAMDWLEQRMVTTPTLSFS